MSKSEPHNHHPLAHRYHASNAVAAATPGGYREVLRIAVPLILSTASLTVTLFVDRMFLSWHGQSEVAAAVPGGITYFTLCSFFMGTAQYVNTLVAQHHGAGDKPACARAVWQGVFFSAISAPLVLCCIPLGRLVLSWAGHGADLTKLEQEYFSILMVGGVMLPFNGALSSFFSGRGETRVVLWGNLAGNLVNVALCYVLIFGKLGAPELGIRGAGMATAASQVVPTIYWATIFLSRRYQPSYRVRDQFRWDRRLFVMLLRYGLPAGTQFCLDVASYTVFVLLVGRLGQVDLAVSSIVGSIEMLSFLPMVGMSIATATLVGRYIGMDEPRLAEKSVRSALKLAMGYMAIMALMFLTFPDVFIEVFRSRGDAQAGFAAIIAKGVPLLRLIAVYTLFDTLFIVYSGALRGAGDTRFAMWAQIIVAWAFFVPPVYLIVDYFKMGLVAAWLWGVVYVIVLGVLFWARFTSGYWKTIHMIRQG